MAANFYTDNALEIFGIYRNFVSHTLLVIYLEPEGTTDVQNKVCDDCVFFCKPTVDAKIIAVNHSRLYCIYNGTPWSSNLYHSRVDRVVHTVYATFSSLMS